MIGERQRNLGELFDEDHARARGEQTADGADQPLDDLHGGHAECLCRHQPSMREGRQPLEIGVFVRSDAELKRARAALKIAGARSVELSEKVEVDDGSVAISTMHFVKGLEFRSLVVMACDDEVIPLQERIESVADDADLEEVHDTERHLFYVACTRARDHLLITGVDPVSEFLDDFMKGDQGLPARARA